MPFEQWKEYVFWTTPKDVLLADSTFRPPSQGYNTYTQHGPHRRARSPRPTLASIDAALNPDTKDGYLFFLAKNDGSGETVFAKTHEEHEAEHREVRLQ